MEKDALWVLRINCRIMCHTWLCVYGRFTITLLVLMLVIRSLIFTGIISRHYELDIKLTTIPFGSQRKFFLDDFETVKCWSDLKLGGPWYLMDFFLGRGSNHALVPFHFFSPWYRRTCAPLSSWLHISLVSASKRRVMKLEWVQSELIWN